MTTELCELIELSAPQQQAIRDQALGEMFFSARKMASHMVGREDLVETYSNLQAEAGKRHDMSTGQRRKCVATDKQLFEHYTYNVKGGANMLKELF